MRRLLVIAAVAALFSGWPASATAQAGGSGSPVEVAAAAGVEAAPQTAPAEPVASGLPERAPQARTMRAYWHVFAAFAITWLLLFGYAVTIGRRFGRLEEEIRRLSGT